MVNCGISGNTWLTCHMSICPATWMSSCGMSVLAKLYLMPLRTSCCIFQNFHLIHHLNWLLHYCSTCGLLPTFSLAMASPLLVTKKKKLAAHEQLVSVTPSDPPLNVIMTLTVGKMICESPLIHVAIRILGIINEVVLFVCGV